MNRRHEPDFNATHTQLQAYVRQARPPMDERTVRALWEDQVKRRLDELEAVKHQVDLMYAVYSFVRYWGKKVVLWGGPTLVAGLVGWTLLKHGVHA